MCHTHGPNITQLHIMFLGIFHIFMEFINYKKYIYHLI